MNGAQDSGGGTPVSMFEQVFDPVVLARRLEVARSMRAEAIARRLADPSPCGATRQSTPLSSPPRPSVPYLQADPLVALRRVGSSKRSVTRGAAFASLIVFVAGALVLAAPLLGNRKAYVGPAGRGALIVPTASARHNSALGTATQVAGTSLSVLQPAALKTPKPVLRPAALLVVAKAAEIPRSLGVPVLSPSRQTTEAVEILSSQTAPRSTKSAEPYRPSHFSDAALQQAAAALRTSGLRDVQILRFAAPVDQTSTRSFRDIDRVAAERSPPVYETKVGAKVPDYNRNVADLDVATFEPRPPSDLLRSGSSISLPLNRDRIGLGQKAPPTRVAGAGKPQLSARNSATAPRATAGPQRSATAEARNGSAARAEQRRSSTAKVSGGVSQANAAHGGIKATVGRSSAAGGKAGHAAADRSQGEPGRSAGRSGKSGKGGGNREGGKGGSRGGGKGGKR